MDQVGTTNSVYPPTDHLTFGPWIYMVPQFKPKNVLMLGYAGGTTAGLIRLLYGDVPITAVDIDDAIPDHYGVEFIKADAQDFVKDCKDYDVVIVDLFPNDSFYVCDFVTSQEFVDNLERISNYIILNTVNNPDLSAYNKIRHVGTNSPSKLGNKIYYFRTKEIPNLFPI